MAGGIIQELISPVKSLSLIKNLPKEAGRVQLERSHEKSLLTSLKSLNVEGRIQEDKSPVNQLNHKLKVDKFDKAEISQLDKSELRLLEDKTKILRLVIPVKSQLLMSPDKLLLLSDIATIFEPDRPTPYQVLISVIVSQFVLFVHPAGLAVSCICCKNSQSI